MAEHARRVFNIQEPPWQPLGHVTLFKNCMMFNKSVIFTFALQATEAALWYGKQHHIAIKIKAK